ncbi:MAG: OmpA/MotB domain protein [Bacteroidota bacterium]|nr:OmpA/MotB domain protein [Bacteroidota bacterium]
MIKKLLLASAAILTGFFANAQLGALQYSPFGGVTNVNYNPAIADSRFIADINLVSVSAALNNNYVGLDRKAIFDHTLFNDPNFQDDHLHERLNGKPKSVYMGMQVQGPLSFMFSFGKGKNKNKNALAFTYHANMIFNADKIDQTFARIAYWGIGYKADSLTNFRGKQLTDANITAKAMSWLDYGVTYSRVIYEKGDHMIKVGGTLKLLNGIEGGYLYVNNLNYKWQNYDTLAIFKTNVNYGYSQGLVSSKGFSASDITNYVKDLLAYKYSTPTVAVDMGMVYEWRPDKDKYKYQMDCKDQYRYDQNRYKLAVGFSIMDFGAVRFKRGTYSSNFNADIQNWDVSHAKFPDGIQSVDDTIRARFQVLSAGTKDYITMWLPTRFNVFIDYNIAYGFGLNGAANISPNMAKDRNMVHQISTFSITPKYDHAWFGFYLPVSYDLLGNINLGVTLRAGPLFVGTQDILGLFAKKYVYNAEVHMGLKVTIPYHKMRDHDKDGVSNKLDQCKTEKGNCLSHGCPDRDNDGVLDKDDKCPDVPGPIELHGCPDTDSDGIVDIEDSCPLVKGPIQFHGCPDRDSDGIIDQLDECPDVPGIARFNGCPDRDSDGVPDKLDHCPDVPGPVDHFGCPDTDKDGVYDDEDQCILTPGPVENHGCPWPDRDGDGIPDKDDQCPDIFGVIENHGCPKLEKKEIETIKYAFDNLEFETGKDIIRSHSFPSLNALADLLVKKANYGLRIEGHTDNVGTDAKNLILSEKRAAAVRNYLIKKGVDGNKLESFGYGASKPVADNDTPEGRQKNRRVEMKIIFK